MWHRSLYQCPLREDRIHRVLEGLGRELSLETLVEAVEAQTTQSFLEAPESQCSMARSGVSLTTPTSSVMVLSAPNISRSRLRVGAGCGGGVGSKAHGRSAGEGFPGDYSVDQRTRSESTRPRRAQGVMVRRAWRVE